MFRYISATVVLLLMSVIVGVGFSLVVPLWNAGVISTHVALEREYRLGSAVPAILTTQTVPKYESLVFVGDVLLARNVEYLIRTRGGEYPFAGVSLTELGADPAVIANFEAAIPRNHKPTKIGMIDFSVATITLPYLKQAGYTHLSLGNNHSFDFDVAGFEHTKSVLHESFESFGNPNDFNAHSISYVTVQDEIVALVGINALNQLEAVEVRNLMFTAEQNSSLQIVYIHWGEEYALRHNKNQSELAKTLVSYGADLIVGHHPHVVQGIDIIDSVPVFYSLGNYIFDQYFSRDVQEGLILSLEYQDGWLIDLVPVSSKNTLSQPNLMNNEDHAAFLEQLGRKSNETLHEAISMGQIDLRADIATSDKIAIMHDTFEYVQ